MGRGRQGAVGCLSRAGLSVGDPTAPTTPWVGSKATTTVPESCRAPEQPRDVGTAWSEPALGRDTGGAGEEGAQPQQGCSRCLPAALPAPSPSTKASLRANTSSLQRLLRDMCPLLFAPKANFAQKHLREHRDPGAQPAQYPGGGCDQQGGHWGQAGAPRGAELRAEQEGREPIGRGPRWVLPRRSPLATRRVPVWAGTAGTALSPKGTCCCRGGTGARRCRDPGRRIGAVPGLCGLAEGTGTHGGQHRGRAPGTALGIATGTAAPGGDTRTEPELRPPHSGPAPRSSHLLTPAPLPRGSGAGSLPPPRAGAALPAEPGAALLGSARLGSVRSGAASRDGPERSRRRRGFPPPSPLPVRFTTPAMNNPPARSP